MLYSERPGPRLFKLLDVRSTDEGRLRDHFGDGRINFRFDAQVLSMQVNEGDSHRIEVLEAEC